MSLEVVASRYIEGSNGCRNVVRVNHATKVYPYGEEHGTWRVTGQYYCQWSCVVFPTSNEIIGSGYSWKFVDTLDEAMSWLES